MGEVYRALDTRLERHVAIKILPERTAQDSEARQRFEREARAIAALSHPAIVTIYEFTITETVLFAVMELLEGETLRSRLIEGPLGWKPAVEIAAAVADGLAAAHAKDVIHRDLKPENIVLVPGQGPKILDFGLARHSPSYRSQPANPRQSRARCRGSFSARSDTCRPSSSEACAADARSDVFALGCILFEMLTAQRPFGGDTPQEIVAATLRDRPPRLQGLHPPAPAELGRIVDHCLAHAPERRFGTARDLAHALSATLTGSGSAP